jgi:hypothetical protein
VDDEAAIAIRCPPRVVWRFVHGSSVPEARRSPGGPVRVGTKWAGPIVLAPVRTRDG